MALSWIEIKARALSFKAHNSLDKAVVSAYGTRFASEVERLADLIECYQQIVSRPKINT